MQCVNEDPRHGEESEAGEAARARAHSKMEKFSEEFCKMLFD